MKTKNNAANIVRISILCVSLANTIWLSAIPSAGGLSLQRLLLIAVICFPAAVAWLSLLKPVGEKLSKNRYLIIRFVNLCSVLILTSAFFFFLAPFARLRFEIAPAIHLRLSPVVLTFTLIALIYFVYSMYCFPVEKDNSVKSSKRESFIDVARGFAIILAVVSHVFFAFGYEVIFHDMQWYAKSFTRFATPTFIIVTGMMFELVYLRKAEKQGFSLTRNTLIKRALQCYFAYGVTVLVEWFNQILNAENALNTMLFVGGSLFSGILKFYTLFLLLAIPVIWLRKRLGIWLIAILPVFVWLGDLLLNVLSWPEIDTPLSFLTSLIFGQPHFSAFSIWHCLTFMSFGMLLGYFLKQAKQNGSWRSFQRTIWALFMLCLAVTLAAVLPISWEEFLYNFANDYRASHHIAYYSVGSMGALLFLWFFWLIREYLNKPWLNVTLTLLGKESLWAFAVGNSFAALLPAANNKPLTVILFIGAVLMATILVIHLKNRIIRVNKLAKISKS